MDLVDIIHEKRFLGQEFLTWLLCQIETNGGYVPVVESKHVYMEVRGMVRTEDGNEMKGQMTCKGQYEPNEVLSGLSNGKKAEQVKLALVENDLEYSFTFKASKFEMTAIKFPKIAPSETEEGEEQEGLLLDRIGLIQAVTGTMEKVFGHFLSLRTKPGLWVGEVLTMRKWLEAAGGQ